MGKFKMSGHTLKGPNQKPSVGKSLQDYQMRDGKLVPISTAEYDEILGTTGKQTLVGDAQTSQVPFKEGALVSDKMTGEARKASSTGTYTVDDNLLKGKNVPEDYYLDETEAGKRRRMATSKSEYQGLDKDSKARYRDVEEQKKVNELAAQGRRDAGKSVAEKKMKFGRKKK